MPITPEKVSAYVMLKEQNQPVTQANIEFVERQLK
jgi:hypothetical protein